MVLESNTLDLLFVKDGEQGTDGKMLYTWIKYAKDDKGTDMTDDPQSAVYIGISYNNESNVESDDPTQYAWTKIQGADGKKGEDAYTIVLENENISFATDENRNPLSEQAYTSRITVMKGATPVTDFGIGDIAKTQGIAIAKGDDGISISVVNGNALPADSGEITVPISVGGTVFKKVLTWTCAKKGEQGVKGDKGDTGQKGQDGTSVKITSKSVTYQTSTSGTTAPTGTWSTTVPTVNNGQYLWTKTTVQYSDGNKTEAYSVSYKGTNGTNGTSVTVSKTEITYQVSTSGTTAPTGTWSTTMPSCDQGQYLWTKTYVKYSDGKDTTSYSVSYKGVDGEKFAFNMLRETNQGSKHWENHASGGKYSTESIITEDGINAVKLICTEAIPSGGWQYVSFDDYQMLKSLKPSTDYVISFDIKSNLGTQGSWVSIQQGDSTNAMLPAAMTHIKGNETWEHIRVFLRSNDTLPKINGQYIYITSLGGVGYSIIKNLKLTEGIVDTPWAPHPEDLEGRGVTEITQWYLATNLSSGVTAGTSGWSTDITTQKITADKKYLWNCHRTKYSDGTMTLISTPAIIGVYGEKGDNAKNLSITPSSQYFKSTDGGKTFAPNQITITPTIQGEINFGKWQYSIDGGVSFADAVSGQKGLTISNNVLTVNKDSSLYSDAVTMVTFRAVASDSSFYDTCSIAKLYDVSDIGDGRNLLWNSNFAKTDEAINTSTYTTWGLILRGNTYTATIDTSVKHNNFNTLKVIGTKAGENGGQDLIYRIKGLNLDEIKFTETGVKYTLSFYAKASIACHFSARYAYDSYAKDTNVALSADWKRYEIQMHPTITSYQTSLIFKMDAASTVWFSEFKLEKGSSATGYSTAPEDVQTAILSTKSEISDVSLKVDNNKQAIEQRVEKTTYERELTLVKGDISKANEGLNKWRYEIYPKSLFTSEYQGKSTMDVFAKNTNLTPSQSVLINDTDLSIAWNYDNNYIGYALTFVKFSAAKSVAITFAHDDGAHIYLNGKLIGGNDVYNNKGESLTLGFVKGWNCIEVVVNEGASTEGFKLGTTLSALSECQLMNCYYGTPVARQSHITNQLVQNTTDIDGVSTKVSKVTSVIGDNGENFTSFKNDYSDFKLAMDGFKTTVGKTYVTKDDFNGLEIGGVNLFVKSTASRGWWISDTGVLNANGGWGYSDYIDVSGMKNYIASGFTNLGISPATCFYDSNKTFISGVESKNQNSQDSKRKTLPIPSNAKYMRFSFALADINTLKIEQGTKATVYSPSPYDDEINGQNLVSNLPANWEQGTVTEGSAVGTTYANTKSASAGSIRPKELIPVSGYITISTAYSNQSQKPIRHWIAAYDVNKNYLGVNYVSNSWNSFPRTLDMKDAKYLAIMVGYTDSSAITPSDISKICLKIERGTSATPFTLAPEDVNGKIQSVETIATQTADKFSWLVKSGTSSSNFELTDKTATLVADKINMDGLVTFNGLSTDAKNGILNSFEVGGRNLARGTSNEYSTEYTNFNGSTNTCFYDKRVYLDGLKAGDTITVHMYVKYDDIVPTSGQTARMWTQGSGNVTGWNSGTFPASSMQSLSGSGVCEILYSATVYKDSEKNQYWDCCIRTDYIQSGSMQIKSFKVEKGNKATDWTPAPEDVSQDATNKASQALTDAKNYSSNAVNWVTSNGASTTSLNSMVKKWTDGAVSDTTQINGGWIKANTITASKIAVGDFTNYCQLNKDTASSYGFTATDDTKGVWFTASPIDRDKDISQWFTCEGSQKLYVEYDLSTTVKGKVNASDTGTSYLTSGIMIFAANGTKEIISYTRSKGVTATSDGTVTHISLVETLPADARFFRVVLQTDGKRNTFSGTLKIRDPQVRKATTGKLIVDGSITANKIATDAIKSRNYISSGGTQGSFLNLSDGSFKSPNLSWDSNGNLIAKNANLSGQITATKGKIGSFNLDKSLYLSNNSPYYFSQFCAKKVYGLTNEGDIYIGSEGIYSYSWETGNMYIGDSGSIQADVSSSRGVCIENGEIYIYKSDYCKDYPTACDNKYGLVLAGGYVASANYSDGGSIDGFNFILTPNKFNINGKIYASNELQTGGDQIRIISGNIGCMVRNDSADFYILRTNSGDPYGGWTNDRPFRINWASNDITCGHNLTANDLIANSWVYCSEVHSSGAVVIASNSESYYWAHGYQMARGTSWGGVCIGDDSQGLRLYGTSIWASHSISTSDENLKENFTTLDQYEDFYMNLNPIGFNYIGDYDGKKTHFGFGAHKTEDILESEGYDSDKFAVVTHRPLVQEDIEKRFGKDVEVDIETEYGVSYTEFIALNTHMIQKTRKELEQVKQEKTDLEARLQAIEAKLGL